jgi:hypothetical protein
MPRRHEALNKSGAEKSGSAKDEDSHASRPGFLMLQHFRQYTSG